MTVISSEGEVKQEDFELNGDTESRVDTRSELRRASTSTSSHEISIPDQSNILKRKREYGSNDAEDSLNSISIVRETSPQLVYESLKTGICYDVRMRYHAKIVTSSYDYVDPHPEDPRRIYRIYKTLAEAGLLHDPSLQGVSDLGQLMLKIPVREAEESELLMVHSKQHLDFIVSTQSMSRTALITETENGDSVYFNNDSLTSAKLSCGGAIEACKSVVEGKVKNALAVVRPPGHHAEPEKAAGFCLFSNVAVAAQVILKEYPESVRRIVVVDWDIHHGNGTQRAFWNDPRVLYISLHRYENGRFYPGTDYGSHLQVGEGKGEGYSINIPWESGGMSDADYIFAFDRIIMPVSREFDPDLVLVSSGFDAAEGDVMGGCHVSPNAYGCMTHMLKSLANGRLVVILEGGYNLDSIAKSALAVTKVLLGEVPGNMKTKVPQSSAVRVVRSVEEVHSKYWDCFKPGYKALMSSHIMGQRRLNGYQSRILSEKFGLISLPILKESIAVYLRDQLMASANVHGSETILVVVHESPEVWGQSDPILGTISPDNSLMIDGAMKFVEWGKSKNYGIVDLNLPSVSSTMSDLPLSLSAISQEACLYIWDNFIEYFEAERVILVGTGEAYSGLVHLAGHREIRERVTSIIGFAGEVGLKAVIPVIDEYVIDWFYRSSLIFTSQNHPVWDANSNPKKPRRKFGRVIRADEDGLSQIMAERFQEAIEFIEDSLEEGLDSEE